VLINFEREAEEDENNFDSFSRILGTVGVRKVSCWENGIVGQVKFSRVSSLAGFSRLSSRFLHNQQPLNASSSSPFECASKTGLKRGRIPRTTHLCWSLLFADGSRNFCKFIRMPWRQKDFH